MVRRMREMWAFLWVVMVVGCMNPLLAKCCDLSACKAGIPNKDCCEGIYKCVKDHDQEKMCFELNEIKKPELAENCEKPTGYVAKVAPCLPPDQKKTSGQQGASKVQSTEKSSGNSALSLAGQRGASKVQSTEESSRNSARRNQVASLILPNSVSFTAAAHSSDDEIGGHIFDFLFAAQDVSTSSLLGAVTLLDSHPDVLAKIREEQDRIRLPGSDARPGFITPELLREMKYTGMEGKEVFKRSFLALGAGPHQCVGQLWPANLSFTCG